MSVRIPGWTDFCEQMGCTQCPDVSKRWKVRCDLPAGHEGPHKHFDNDGRQIDEWKNPKKGTP